MKSDQIIRLCDENGNHKLTVIYCSENCYDLATPDGKVLYCGMPSTLINAFLVQFKDQPLATIEEVSDAKDSQSRSQ